MSDNKKYKIGITVKGNWQNNVPYEVLDMVLYRVEDGGNGGSWTAIEPNVGIEPGNDPNIWVPSTQPGQSIYELCVARGTFVGTEEEFVQQYNAAVQGAINAGQQALADDELVRTNEQSRQLAETSRVSAENARQLAESARHDAEVDRATAETARNNAETERNTAEGLRAQAETQRQNAETQRASAEENRDAAEEQRASTFNDLVDDINTAVGGANAAAQAANAAAQEGESINSHQPRINTTTNHWEIWNYSLQQYEDSGIVAIPVDKGSYDPNATYDKLDLVHTTDSSYISKKDNNTNHLVTNTEWWICVADGKPATAAASAANTAADAANAAAGRAPYIGDNGNWWVWSTSQDAYVDSGVDATAPVITIGPDYTIYKDGEVFTTAIKEAAEQAASDHTASVEATQAANSAAQTAYDSIGNCILGIEWDNTTTGIISAITGVATNIIDGGIDETTGILTVTLEPA